MTEYSTRFSREGSTGEGTAMRREQHKIDPNKVLSLPPGEAYIINQGKAMHAHILKAPEANAPLPEPHSPPPAPSEEGNRDDKPKQATDWDPSSVS